MAVGDITDVIDSLEFDNANGEYPDIINISGEVYALVYEAASGAIKVVTVKITVAGGISTVIDTETIDAGPTVSAPAPKIIFHPGSSDKYIIAWTASGNDGWVATVTISTAGAISTTINSKEFSTTADFLDIIHVTGNIFAVVYRGVGSDGFIDTITIDTSGNITTPSTATLEFDTSNAPAPTIIQVAGQVYAISYRISTSSLKIATVNIDAAGALTAIDTSLLGTIAISGVVMQHPLIKVAGTVYAVVYGDPTPTGNVITFTISNTGVIALTPIATLQFEDTRGREFSIAKISAAADQNGIYAVAYQGVGSDGFIKTFQIFDNGALGSVLSTLEFDTSQALRPDLILVSSATGTLAIAYGGPSSDGFIKTLGVAALSALKSAGFKWVEGDDLHIIDASGVERVLVNAPVDTSNRAAILGWIIPRID